MSGIVTIIEAITQYSGELTGVPNKIRQDLQCFFGKPLAIVMRGGVAVIAIGKPPFNGVGIHQAMFSGLAQQVFVEKLIYLSGIPTECLQSPAQQFAGGFQR
jgi:hypothetical protein